MLIRIRYRSRTGPVVLRRQSPGAWAPAVLAAFLLASAAGIVAIRQARSTGEAGNAAIAPFPEIDLGRLTGRQGRAPRRFVYPYSVVPGGVASPEEVADIVRRDPVVAHHYSGFDPRRARTVTLREPRLAYVSYRIRDKVFFTKKPVRLFAGEQVITDGKTTIRARCGNKVEEAPQMAVSPEEPPEEILNTPRLEPEPERAAPVAPGLAVESPEKEAPLAAVAPPPGFAPLDMPARGPGSTWLAPPSPGPGFLPPASSPGPGGTLPPPPPAGPGPEPGTPPPAVPLPPPVVTPPPVTPPGTTPPGAPPSTPPAPPSTPPPDTPPAVPPATPPGTPVPPPATPPVTPPSAPAGPPVTPPPALPPSVPGTPASQPPPGVEVPPPGPLPPPVLPPPPSNPEDPLSEPPPEILIPPPDGTPPPDVPEPPPIPEPSTYVLVAAGLLALSWIRRLKGRPR